MWKIILCVIIIAAISLLYKFLKFKYTDEAKAADYAIYKKIIDDLLPYNGAIAFLRTNNFAGFSFRISSIQDLYNIEAQITNPHLIFINPKLEKIRKKLFEEVSQLLSLVGTYTFWVSEGIQSIPQKLELNNPEIFNKEVNEIHAASKSICAMYDKLIHTYRKYL